MKNIITKSVLVFALLLSLSGCSIMAGFFPDKEKDYQFSSEIAPLKIPAEVSNKTLLKKQSTKLKEEDKERLAVSETDKASVKADVASKEASSLPVHEKEEPVHVELVKFANGETRLQINRPVVMSWRMISKALTHKSIEITARDQANGEFTVQYDPNETNFSDETFMDEIMFVFAEDHSQEKPYFIKLLARDKMMSEAVILDGQGKPSNAGGGLSLLKLLASSIKADLADN